jgi:hypothetical protein
MPIRLSEFRQSRQCSSRLTPNRDGVKLGTAYQLKGRHPDGPDLSKYTRTGIFEGVSRLAAEDNGREGEVRVVPTEDGGSPVLPTE